MDLDQTPSTSIGTTKNINSGSSKTLKITTGIMSVVAVVGIAFGVYGMIQSQSKDNQLSDYKVQVKESDGTITEISANEIETSEDNGNIITIVETANTIDPTSYLYLGAWGLKIAIPDTLKTVNYTYSARDTLCISGVKYREGRMQYLPEFGDITVNTPGLVCVSRTLKDGYSYDDSPLEAYEYIIQNSQAVYSMDSDEQNWEAESMKEIKNMLDFSNFSRI